jgi:proline dehydrogenase
MDTENRAVDLTSTEPAFNNYTNTQLIRKYKWFKLLSRRSFSSFIMYAGYLIKPFPKFLLAWVKRIGVYSYFCTGETLAECLKCANNLYIKNISSIPDFCMEGIKNEKEGDIVNKEITKLIKLAENNILKIPIVVFKITGLVKKQVLEEINNSIKQNKTFAIQNEINKVIEIVGRVCKQAFNSNVKIMIDAEESWIQDAIDLITLEMQRRFNKEKVIVINTYQTYKISGGETLREHFDCAIKENFFLGCKLVRGAYMEKERKRAIERKYETPIYDFKCQTDNAYNLALEFCITSLDRICLIVATHNQESLEKLIDIMRRNKIKSNTSNIYISQLYGMGDVLSFNMALAGYNVCKYLPYGPIKKSIPYLSRRAQENSVTKEITRNEALTIKQEIIRRGIKP